VQRIGRPTSCARGLIDQQNDNDEFCEERFSAVTANQSRPRASNPGPLLVRKGSLADHGVLASVGSVGDAYDNALAESFVDSFKTELIADRVWRTRSQLELAVVEYLGRFNAGRLHQALGDVPPAEFEALSPSRTEAITSTIMSKETQLTRSP
jgi:putative transposase